MYSANVQSTCLRCWCCIKAWKAYIEMSLKGFSIHSYLLSLDDFHILRKVLVKSCLKWQSYKFVCIYETLKAHNRSQLDSVSFLTCGFDLLNTYFNIFV